MTGVVDSRGRALVRVRLRRPGSKSTKEIDAWIDTGFTGELVLPTGTIKALKLTPEHSVKAELGDGSEATFDTYPCLLEWFGEWKELEALGSTGGLALLGVGLLKGHALGVDYEKGNVTIT